jgi:hypothetical protein
MTQKNGFLSGRLDNDSALIFSAYSLPLDNKRIKHERILAGAGTNSALIHFRMSINDFGYNAQGSNYGKEF